jgi:hypothetical protein
VLAVGASDAAEVHQGDHRSIPIADSRKAEIAEAMKKHGQ